jgi:hypothetical protein
MFEALGSDNKLEILDSLVKLEHDGCFGAPWLELLHRFILGSAGMSTVSIPSARALKTTGFQMNFKPSGTSLINLYSILCRRLAETQEIRAHILTIRCMSCLLEKEVGTERNGMMDYANPHDSPGSSPNGTSTAPWQPFRRHRLAWHPGTTDDTRE